MTFVSVLRIDRGTEDAQQPGIRPLAPAACQEAEEARFAKFKLPSTRATTEFDANSSEQSMGHTNARRQQETVRPETEDCRE